MSNRYPTEPRITMQPTMTQLISAGKNSSPVKRTHTAVNGRAAIMVNIARLAEAMSGGVRRVTRSLTENPTNAKTAHSLFSPNFLHVNI